MVRQLHSPTPLPVSQPLPRPICRSIAFIPLLAALLLCPTLLIAARQDATKPSPAASVTFSPMGGILTNPVSLKITASASGGVIRYTLDGTEPTEQSPAYSTPIAITNTVLVRARAVANGSNNPGATLSQTYTFLDDELAGFTSNLPLVIINAFGQDVEKEEKTAVTARFVNVKQGNCSIISPAEFDGRALVNLRGRASLRYPKRSYTFRPIDEEDEYLKVSLLGLPADSDWILYAPYPDKTFIRDVLAYEISNEMGQYASRTRFVELFLNETTGKLNKLAYMGIYVLEEKIKRAKHRVDIEKLDPRDNAEPKVTGGYIFKKDHGPDGGEMVQVNIGGFPGMQGGTSSNRTGYPTGPGGFPADPAGFLPPYTGVVRESSSSSSPRRTGSSSTANVTNRIGLIFQEPDELSAYRFSSSSSSGSSRERFVTKPQTNELYYVYPEPEDITAAQRAFLSSYLNKFEAALYGKNFADAASGYRAYIDVPSFIDHHIIVEMSKNVDGYRFSTFFHKDRGGKVKLGPIWDWNLSFGNANGKQGWLPEYWMWPQLTDKEYSWFRRLFQDPDFGQQYVDRWAELRANVLAAKKLMARIDHFTNTLEQAQIRNYERWPILGRQVWPQYTWGDTYAQEVDFMKDWLRKRLDWIDAQFLAPPVITAAAEITIAAPKGKIYYTIDGTDPRKAGGQPSAASLIYSAPIKSLRTKLFVRSFDGNRWSAPAIRSF